MSVVLTKSICHSVDNPQVQSGIPTLFRITVNGVCYYALRFYSRPFLDAVYVVQYFLSRLISTASKYYATYSSAGSSRVRVSIPSILNFRGLSEGVSDNWNSSSVVMQIPQNYGHAQSDPNSYVPVSNYETNPILTADFISEHQWHSIKIFAHYFLGLFFIVFAVLFTVYMWHIGDFSDNKEVQRWVRDYVAVGWWKRGGLRLAQSILRGLIALTVFVYFLFALSQEFSAQAIPTGQMMGSVLCIGASVLIIIWFIGYRLFKVTEALFERYVSQNVNYTSLIILKRIVKSKLELGYMLMFLLYAPVLYTFLQSVIMI